jgi:hypothetical protein
MICLFVDVARPSSLELAQTGVRLTGVTENLLIIAARQTKNL